MIPLTIGTPEQFCALRGFLEQANYTEPAICERLGLRSIYEFKAIYEHRSTGLEIRDCLDALIHLLMDGEALDECRVRTLLPAGALAAAEALGVLCRLDEEPERPFYSTAFLYPVAGLYAASDRTTPPNPKNPVRHSRDVVYAAITGNTSRFLAAQPPLPCEDLLDLCSGTGIAAMVAAARYAKHAWACDITERSVHFSDFNRRLNGLDNVTAARGDLYEAAGDRTFDRIVAHPPYVPSEKQEWVFRDGGVDGEQILKRIVEGLPRYLRPEGRFYCVTLATDREGETFEQRIRRWLGTAESEFDVVLAANEVRKLPDEFRRAEIQRKAKRGQAEAMEKLMADLKVTGTFYGTVAIRRKTEKRPAVTARTMKTPESGSEGTEWLLDFETAAVERPDFEAFLLGSRPHLAPGLKMIVTHAAVGGVLVPSEFSLRSDFPFAVNGECQQWVAVAVTWCNGERTVADLYRELRGQEVINPAMTERELVAVVRLLIANGVLEIDEFPLPALPA